MRDSLQQWKNRLRSKSRAATRPAVCASHRSQNPRPASPITPANSQILSASSNAVQSSSSSSGQSLVSSPSLWKDAADQLPPKAQEILENLAKSSQNLPTSAKNVAAELISLAEKRRDVCEERRWKFKFGEQEIILRDLADKVVIWLTKFKEIGDVVVNYDPVHLALPWAGVRFLLQCAVQDAEQTGTLLVGLEKITCLMGRCEVYEELYVRQAALGFASEGLKKVLIDVYRVILTFLAEVHCLYEQNLTHRVLSTIFDPQKLERVLGDLGELEPSLKYAADNCESFYRRGQDDAFDRKLKKLDKILEDLDKPIQRTDGRVATLLSKLADSERSEILCWISSVPYLDNHKNARSGRAASTGHWLLEHDTYRAWRKTSASTILWLHGIPGAGKTKLVTHVVDDIMSSFAARPTDEAFAYFYCDRNDRDRQDPLCIMQSFVKQLATPQTDGALQSSVVDIFKHKKRSGFASMHLDMNECQDLLYRYIDSYPSTTLVLDALDECQPQTRGDLIKILDESIRRAARPTRILISSRRDDDIKRRFEGGPNVAISATDNIHDITAFVVQRLDTANESRDMKISAVFRAEIVNTLREKSRGMFQWATLQLNQLLEIDLEEDMRARLSKLPEDLKQAYDEIYARITKPGGRTTESAIRAFRWVMQAEVPLSTNQLVAAVCQDPETDDVGVVDVSISFILKACHNLLVVDDELDVCRFAHLSVQEYLERDHLKPIEADHLISKVSLQLLMHGSSMYSKLISESEDEYAKIYSSKFCDPYSRCTIRTFSCRHDCYPLSDLMVYVILHWSTHIHRCEAAQDTTRLTRLLMKFFGHPSKGTDAYQWWIKLFEACRRHSLDVISTDIILEHLNPTNLPVLAMCHLGLFSILEDWWTLKHIEPLTRTSEGSTLLLLAAQYGHYDICKRLICHGADVNAINDLCSSPLSVASGRGHLGIVQLLLDHGADVNNQANLGGCGSLASAVYMGHVDIVRLLLDHGGQNVNECLVAASKIGSLHIVRLLLEYGADVNTQADSLTAATALIAASNIGSFEVVQLLINHGADANIQDISRMDSTALITASRMGYLEIVRLLLDHGAYTNSQSTSWVDTTALVAASRMGHLEIVQLLLDRGADVNSQGSSWVSATPLISASRSRRLEIVQLLLDHGADVNAQNQSDNSALFWARQRNDQPMVESLLMHGATEPMIDGDDASDARYIEEDVGKAETLLPQDSVLCIHEPDSRMIGGERDHTTATESTMYEHMALCCILRVSLRT